MTQLDNFFNRMKDKKILIQGLGLNGGGTGTALFFVKNGFKVKITDTKDADTLRTSVNEFMAYSNKVEFVLGKHDMEDFTSADVVIKGPGVHPDNEYIQAARAHGAEILSDIGIFMEIAPCEIYAVTGSKGKSTTVSAIYSIFKQYSDNSYLGGNITISPLTFYDKLDENSLVVLELSSWQLRDIADKNIRFKGVIITNLMNDHQNYYKSMERYLNDKLIITRGQHKGDFLIIPEDDGYIKKDLFNQGQNIFTFGTTGDMRYTQNSGVICYDHKDTELFKENSIQLKGTHQRLNILSAAGLAYFAGIDPDSINKGILSFTGVPFRMEKIREWKGVTFINDTTATIPEAAGCAVKSFDKNLIWIAGGNDKNLDFQCIKEIESIPKRIYFLKGDGTEKIKEIIQRTDYMETDSLENIIQDVAAHAKPGDTVLFSPGCTSFGLFQNEFHRGRVFNELVNSLE